VRPSRRQTKLTSLLSRHIPEIFLESAGHNKSLYQPYPGGLCHCQMSAGSKIKVFIHQTKKMNLGINLANLSIRFIKNSRIANFSPLKQREI
jgi:hypothetical protein